MSATKLFDSQVDRSSSEFLKTVHDKHADDLHSPIHLCGCYIRKNTNLLISTRSLEIFIVFEKDLIVLSSLPSYFRDFDMMQIYTIRYLSARLS